ncbi:hypothetical protein M3O75_06195 [Klebsiella pneumoniae]|nr:hypothetical protein [Klebsiella pneumoniae]
MLAMSGGALAAQVPPGTQLAEKQELVRNNGSEPASSIRIKSRAMLNSISLAISLKGWLTCRQRGDPAATGGTLGKQRQPVMDLSFTPRSDLV